MGLRPQAARWFELLIPREELTKTLECLADTQAVELQTHSQPEQAVKLPGLDQALDRYGELARVHGAWWPTGRIPVVEDALEPVNAMREALENLQAWAAEAGPLIEEIEHLEVNIRQLDELNEALDASDAQLPALHQLAAAGPMLAVRIYRLAPGLQPRTLPTSILTEWFVSSSDVPHLIAVGPDTQIEALDRQMAALKARRIQLPKWLPDKADEACKEIGERRAQLLQQRDDGQTGLDQLHRHHDLQKSIGTMELMAWFAGHAPSLPVTDHFAWITGWTSDLDGHEINQALDRGKVRHLLRYRPPPEGAECPVVMHNPRWVKPFELFPGLLGTPDSGEADPSRIVAVLAPLMFGFMFGDVGQGAVLLAIGLLLRKRAPVLGLLVPFGIMAIIFGFLFGSIFANEELIPALWMHPIDHPTEVMGIAITFGIFILTMGLLLDALGAYWRRLFIFWLSTRGGLLVAYVGLVTAGAGYLGALAAPAGKIGLYALMAGSVWFIVGSTITSIHGKLAEIPKAAGELVESLLQIGVNTISFVRVGAFALAHAGLSAAVIGLADATGGGIGWLLVMILGNALIIALEGLIVSIQTTRLLLFEFFIRFLTAQGRQLHPLAGPGTTLRLIQRS